MSSEASSWQRHATHALRWPHWPHSPVPDTAEWTRRCLAHLLHLDPALERNEAQEVADDMSQRPHWRSMQPEHAAETLFLPIGTHGLQHSA